MNNRCALVVVAGLSAESTFHAPERFMRRGRGAAEVLVLPHGGAAQALVVPAPEQVRELAANSASKAP
jgi:hypothetical protein